MREAILTLILCLNMTTSTYAQTEEVTVEPVNISIEQEVENRINELDKSDLEQWFIQYQQIQLEYSDRLDPDETIHDVISDKEFNLFAKIVESEAEGKSFSQKIHVAQSIINRWNSPEFPDTITGVITERKQYTPYLKGTYKKKTPTESTIRAIEYSYQFEDTTQGATYFCSNKSKWHINNLEFIWYDGAHYFYRLK